MRRIMYCAILICLGYLPVQAQAQDTLSIRVPTTQLVGDSADDTAIPASHRTVEKRYDRPVVVLYCPQPTFPRGLADYGFDGQVTLRYVVDTLGLAELRDLVVVNASHVGFLPSARRAIAKCRYRPATKAGHPVRVLVQQRIVFSHQRAPE